MQIETIPVGMLQENCYLLKKDNSCLIVDPGDEFDQIKKRIGNLNVLAILITHHHFDHVGALEECKKEYGVPVFEFETLEEKHYQIGLFSFHAIFTPGHTKDSVTYYFPLEKKMFTGDFIFKESIGRMDLEGGSLEDMLESLTKIKQYSDDITLYPGHGESSMLGIEKQENYYLSRV